MSEYFNIFSLLLNWFNRFFVLVKTDLLPSIKKYRDWIHYIDKQHQHRMGPAVGGACSFSLVLDKWCTGYLLGLNGPRIPSRAKMKIYWMPVHIDMAGVLCSRMLRQRPLSGSCLKIARSNGIRSYAPFFIWLFGFGGSTAKLWWLLPSCGTISRSMVKWANGECHGSQDLRTNNGGSSFCDDGNWLSGSWLGAAASGGDITGEVQSFPFQDENPRSVLPGNILIEALFCERRLSPGRKPKIYDRTMTMLVHYFLLEGIAFGEADVVLVVSVADTRNRSLQWGFSFYSFFLFRLVVCINNTARTLRCCRD
jgi:hypothetical protein